MTIRDRRRHRAWLRQLGPFGACTDKELDRVDQLTTTVEVEAGAVVCREGHHGHESFFVVAGEAAVAIDGHVIASLGPGSFFGEMSVLEGTRRVASVTARTPMTLLASSPRELEALIADIPQVGRRMLATMSTRLRLADRALASAEPA